MRDGTIFIQAPPNEAHTPCRMAHTQFDANEKRVYSQHVYVLRQLPCKKNDVARVSEDMSTSFRALRSIFVNLRKGVFIEPQCVWANTEKRARR
eukprot:3727014-Pleurochrysis_carterae.AAC.1